jgi:hypothetical protein
MDPADSPRRSNAARPRPRSPTSASPRRATRATGVRQRVRTLVGSPHLQQINTNVPAGVSASHGYTPHRRSPLPLRKLGGEGEEQPAAAWRDVAAGPRAGPARDALRVARVRSEADLLHERAHTRTRPHRVRCRNYPLAEKGVACPQGRYRPLLPRTLVQAPGGHKPASADLTAVSSEATETRSTYMMRSRWGRYSGGGGVVMNTLKALRGVAVAACGAMVLLLVTVSGATALGSRFACRKEKANRSSPL